MKKIQRLILGVAILTLSGFPVSAKPVAKIEPIQVAVNKSCLVDKAKQADVIFAVQVMPISTGLGGEDVHFERTTPVSLGAITDNAGSSTISFTLDDVRKAVGPELKNFLVSAMLCKGSKIKEGKGSCEYPILYRALTMKGNYLESISENGQVDIQVIGDSKLSCAE